MIRSTWFLLNGLSSDYDPIRQNLQLPRENKLKWHQVTALLLQFAMNPKVPGCKFAARAVNPAINTTVKETCSNFARTGTCKFGNRCRYLHVPAPGLNNTNARPTCSYCNKLGHNISLKNAIRRSARTKSVIARTLCHLR